LPSGTRNTTSNVHSPLSNYRSTSEGAQWASLLTCYVQNPERYMVMPVEGGSLLRSIINRRSLYMSSEQIVFNPHSLEDMIALMDAYGDRNLTLPMRK